MVLSAQGTRMRGRLSGMIDRQLNSAIKTTLLVFLLFFCIAALAIKWIDMSIFAGLYERKIEFNNKSEPFPTSLKYCSVKCPETVPLRHTVESSSVEECPEYFRWIHEDLHPWKATGITREMVERAQNVSHIRIVVVQGRVYVEKFKQVFQTRDVVTIWGLLQLLKLYPGRLPDLDLMFECNDMPVIRKADYHDARSNTSVPPPVFHYCGDDASFDIVFPDWSFWGWPELNIKPWEILKEDLQESNNKIKWLDREPYAYWKGNALLGPARENLVKCNVSNSSDQNARIYNMVATTFLSSLSFPGTKLINANSGSSSGEEIPQHNLGNKKQILYSLKGRQGECISGEWQHERKQGFKTSDLASQCNHRYKVYVEGIAWSVSEKYILACDSVTLLITPQYYDFFTRSLLPMIHYWPINVTDICRSIKFSVDWGNKNAEKAQEIGKAGSKFVQEELRMKFIYDYMFHVLSEYGKLLKYQPTIPEGAVEVCSENMLCNVNGRKKKFRLRSQITSPANSSACIMPPPFDNKTLQAFLQRKHNLTKQVEILKLSTAKEKSSR